MAEQDSAPAIERAAPRGMGFAVSRSLRVRTVPRRPGPPQRSDGLDIGIITLSGDAPHGGEVHPDGDENLYVISGRLRVVGDSAPEHPVELGPGDACIVRCSEWCRVQVLEPTRLVHVTPGPHGGPRQRAPRPLHARSAPSVFSDRGLEVPVTPGPAVDPQALATEETD